MEQTLRKIMNKDYSKNDGKNQALFVSLKLLHGDLKQVGIYFIITATVLNNNTIVCFEGARRESTFSIRQCGNSQKNGLPRSHFTR